MRKISSSLLFLFALAIAVPASWAGDIVEIDGITYDVSSASAKVVSASQQIHPLKGDIYIPDNITHEDKEKSVYYIAGDAFRDNPDITSLRLPRFSPQSDHYDMFSGCSSLKKVELAENQNFINYIFRNAAALEELEIPGRVSTIPSGAFDGCNSLRRLVILPDPEGRYGRYGNEIKFEGTLSYSSIPLEEFVCGKNIYYINTLWSPLSNTQITSATFMEGVTKLAMSMFRSCKTLSSVTLPSTLTKIGEFCFLSSGLKSFTAPENLQEIGEQAFCLCELENVTLNDKLERIGKSAFIWTTINSPLHLPASLSEIANCAFFNSKIPSITVDPANEHFAISSYGALTTKDGSELVYLSPSTTITSITDPKIKRLRSAALYTCKSLESIDIPNCVDFGYASLCGTSIKGLTLRGNVSASIVASCEKLEKLIFEGSVIPENMCYNCGALKEFIVPEPYSITIIGGNAFEGCKSLETLNFGSSLQFVGNTAFATSGKKLEISLSSLPPRTKEDCALFTSSYYPAECEPTLIVPNEYVAEYKNAEGWNAANIVGSASLTPTEVNTAITPGLYYTGPDGKVHCRYDDGSESVIDIATPGAINAYSLKTDGRRIYGNAIGDHIFYQSFALSDGHIFAINFANDQPYSYSVMSNYSEFRWVTRYYADPFTCEPHDGKIYFTERSGYDDTYVLSSIDSDQFNGSLLKAEGLMKQSNFAYYGNGLAYGFIPSCMQITDAIDSNGNKRMKTYMSFMYNGMGILQMYPEHFDKTTYPDEPLLPMWLQNRFIEAFYVDEAHGHVYFSDHTNEWSSCIYRANIADLDADPNVSADKLTVIDDSPFSLSGYPGWLTGSEWRNTSQLSVDERGEYLYWSYHAPHAHIAIDGNGYEHELDERGDMRNSNATLDPSNPLHQTGIKRVKLGEANPKVEMAALGADAYGVLPYRFEGSSKPDGVESVNAPVGYKLMIADGVITTPVDAIIDVYTPSGAAVMSRKLAAGTSIRIPNNGIYLVKARFNDGSTSTVKAAVR